MDRLERALRSILEATGAARAFSPTQLREILGHLEDSVDEKVRLGVPELEAAARALEELGDLREISRKFRQAQPELAHPTLEGWLAQPTCVPTS
jgi:hypothetical protein